MRRGAQVSTVTRTYCDICGQEFTDSYWDHQPCHVVLSMSAPAQAYDNKDCKHVCRGCRDNILRSFKKAPQAETAT